VSAAAVRSTEPVGSPLMRSPGGQCPLAPTSKQRATLAPRHAAGSRAAEDIRQRVQAREGYERAACRGLPLSRRRSGCSSGGPGMRASFPASEGAIYHGFIQIGPRSACEVITDVGCSLWACCILTQSGHSPNAAARAAAISENWPEDVFRCSKIPNNHARGFVNAPTNFADAGTRAPISDFRVGIAYKPW
jgi:hypothetical protein